MSQLKTPKKLNPESSSSFSPSPPSPSFNPNSTSDGFPSLTPVSSFPIVSFPPALSTQPSPPPGILPTSPSTHTSFLSKISSKFKRKITSVTAKSTSTSSGVSYPVSSEIESNSPNEPYSPTPSQQQQQQSPRKPSIKQTASFPTSSNSSGYPGSETGKSNLNLETNRSNVNTTTTLGMKLSKGTVTGSFPMLKSIKSALGSTILSGENSSSSSPNTIITTGITPTSTTTHQTTSSSPLGSQQYVNNPSKLSSHVLRGSINKLSKSSGDGLDGSIITSGSSAIPAVPPLPTDKEKEKANSIWLDCIWDPLAGITPYGCCMALLEMEFGSGGDLVVGDVGGWGGSGRLRSWKGKNWDIY